MSRKLLLSALLSILLLPSLMASHYMGGEITWECLPNGNYRFIMKVYRECQGCLGCYANQESLNTNIGGGLSIITIDLYPNIVQGKKDLSPDCNSNPGFPHINCFPAPSLPNTGAVEEYTYTTDAAYPLGVNLPAGPIPAGGWTFSYTSCCRNPCTNYTGADGADWWLRAVMYPYPSQSPDNCWDNSPSFGEKPTTVICTGYPFTYNPNGFDQELDSLAYTWTQPLETASTPLGGINPGYSFTSPLPGTTQNPNNVPAVVNPITGEVSFTSYTSGAFVTAYKVTAYKCGTKIAEIFREMQVVLLSCPEPFNTPPVVDPPFINPITGLQTEYIDTVFAGAIVDFYLNGIDFDYLNDSVNVQNLSILASGLQFGGNNFTDAANGCLAPPCATLNPPPPATNAVLTATNFTWQTTCGHLATENPCGGFTNSYNFVLKVKDDFCPAPAYAWKTVTIVVKNPIMPPPEPKCISVADNGHVTLNWKLSDTLIVPNSWSAYYFYRSTNAAGPFTLVDSIVLDVPGNVLFHNTTSYTDVTANGQATTYFYYMKVRSGCYGDYYSANSDTLHTIDLSVTNIGNGVGHFQWNATHIPPIPTSTGMYHIYRQDATGPWYLYDSTLALQKDKDVYGCGYIMFKIGIYDSTGCESISSIDTALFGAAQAPILNCISVEPNGSVTVSYQPPSGSPTSSFFSAYLVYSSNNLFGPYTLIDSVLDPALTSWNIGGVNANAQSLYFYFVTRINCGAPFYSSGSDTLRTIFLDVTNLSPATANLDWNVIRIPSLPTSSNAYDVSRQYPGNLWSLLGTTPTLTMGDGLILCDDSIPYQIRMADATGCFSASNIAKARYYDHVPPPTPILDSVSVDSLTGNVIIGWIPNEAETIGYILFYEDNGTWPLLDTIWGTNNTLYIDSKSPGNACDRVKNYAIAAIDSCWNVSPMGVNGVHNTLLVTIKDVDPCEARVTLDWNPYSNMNGLIGYNIFYNENNGPKTLLGTVTSSVPGQDPPTEYNHINYQEKSRYCYSIQAFNASGTITSSSCEICLYAVKPKQPKFNYLKLATVEENRFIRLKIHLDTAAYVTQYKIMRSTEKAGPYDAIGTMPPQIEPDVVFDDFNAQPKLLSYYYFIMVVDSCGLEVLASDTSRTMLLTVESNIDFTNHVVWNDYEGWEWSAVNAYNLFRGIDGMMDPIPIATLPYGKTDYIDDVSGYIETQGKFLYYVEAVERTGGWLPYVDTSYSNTAGDVQRSLVFIPNAFSPKGYNNIFKPVSSFVDMNGYIFQIYNRWGEIVFETTDPNHGWDGTYEGDFVPAGVYVYYVKCHTSESQVYERRSTVTVIK